MLFRSEYGDALRRPHYHLCLFNLDFGDKTLHTVRRGFEYFVSPTLQSLWPYGHSLISALTFDSAAYVARYCTKKITGDIADDHYQGRLPEFGQASLKPGIGSGWLDRFGFTDVWNHDNVVVDGALCKPPRYYDKVLERLDPVAYERMRKQRLESALLIASDNNYDRLLVKEKCHKARVKDLRRPLEVSNGY